MGTVKTATSQRCIAWRMARSCVRRRSRSMGRVPGNGSTSSVGESARPKSAMTPCRIIRECSFFDEEFPNNQPVHAGAEESANRLGWAMHNGFSAQIKRRIHDDRDAGALSELIDEPPIDPLSPPF